MMEIMFVIPLVAWLAFVHFQYHSGDRPATYLWFAVMAGLGTFECTKGLFGLTAGMPATTLAFGAGLFAAACVLIAHLRPAWSGKPIETSERVIAAEGH